MLNIIDYALAKKEWDKAYDGVVEFGSTGRNLVRYIDDPRWFDFANAQIDIDAISKRKVKVSGTTSNSSSRYATVILVNPETTYTVTVNIIEATNSFFLMREKWDEELYNRGNYSTLHSPDYTRTGKSYVIIPGQVRYTFTTKADTKTLILEFGSSGSGEFSTTFEDVKVEVGTTATPYAPTPEDVGLHPFVTKLSEMTYQAKVNEEESAKINTAITAIGGSV